MPESIPRREIFSLPAGLRLSPGQDGIDVEFDGDIVLQGSPQPRLGRVCSTGGDVVVQGELDAGALEAPAGRVLVNAALRAGRVAGRAVTVAAAATVDEIVATEVVELRGGVVAGRIQAETVLAEGPNLTARVVEGRRSVRVGRGRVQADILIAPSVVLDPNASGKVKVVESLNDLGAHAVRGCLRLSDLEDMGGNAASFLAERNLQPLAPGPEPEIPTLIPTPLPAQAPTAPVMPPSAPQPPAPPPPAPPPSARPALADVPLDTLTGEVSVDLDEVLDSPTDPVHAEIALVLDRILNCYAGADLPPAVADLRDWVRRRDYNAVRDGITNAWNQLLRFHQKQGLRIQPQVTTNFNQLNTLVRRL